MPYNFTLLSPTAVCFPPARDRMYESWILFSARYLEANPFEITVKLDSAVSANRLTFVGSSVSGQYATYVA